MEGEERISCGETAPHLPDNHGLCRRFIDDPNHLTWEGDRPIPHPMSDRAINMEKGRAGLSTSWREHIERDGLEVSAVLGDDSNYTLVGQIQVGVARGIGMNVYHSPEGSHPIDCAHSSIDWPHGSEAENSDRPPKSERKRLKNELARSFEFVHGNVKSTKPFGG